MQRVQADPKGRPSPEVRPTPRRRRTKHRADSHHSLPQVILPSALAGLVEPLAWRLPLLRLSAPSPGSLEVAVLRAFADHGYPHFVLAGHTVLWWLKECE